MGPAGAFPGIAGSGARREVLTRELVAMRMELAGEETTTA